MTTLLLFYSQSNEFDIQTNPPSTTAERVPNRIALYSAPRMQCMDTQSRYQHTWSGESMCGRIEGGGAELVGDYLKFGIEYVE